jgi:hypothetical protein
VSTSKNHQLKKSLPSTSHLIFLSTTSCRCIREATGSDQVEVGQGEGGGRWHDGGEGQHEVSPCLVFSKSLVSISKIHIFRWNLRILSTRMSPTWCAKRIYAVAIFGWEIRRWWCGHHGWNDLLVISKKWRDCRGQ